MEATRLQMQNFLIFLLDLVGVTVGYFAAVWLRFGNIETGYTVMGNDTYYRWLIAIVVLMMIYFLFRPNRGFFKRKFIEEMRMNLQTVVLMAAGMAMVAFLIQDAEDYSRFIYIFTSGFGFVWMQITHRAYRKYWLSRRKDHSYARKMMIITTSDYAEEVIGNIMEEKNWDLWITSVAVVDKDMTGWLINEIPVVAHSYRSIFEYAMRSVVDEVFLYIPMDDEFPIAVTVQNFEDMGIKTNLNISQFQINENLERSLEKVGPYESVSFSGHNVSFVMLMMKRAMDIAGGLVGMLITAIAVIIVGPLVKLESPGPLFFSQKRVGKNGRIFKIYKIRSMYQDAEERKKELMAQNEMDGLMFKMKDDPRITKVGKFIRKTSIDELPQFWNVLKGDMSLVGTRPPTVDEFEQYSAYHKKRLCQKPGLTGVWQVSGRSTITDFEEIVQMDVDYIDHWSIWRDIGILFKTVWLVVCGDDGAVWNCSNGADLFYNTVVEIKPDAVFNTGYFSANGGSVIIAHKNINFGEDVMIGRNVIVYDSDFHTLYNRDGSACNPPEPVTIEDHVWLTSNIIVQKGVTVGKDSLITAYTTINKNVPEHSIFGGSSVGKVIKEPVSWGREVCPLD